MWCAQMWCYFTLNPHVVCYEEAAIERSIDYNCQGVVCEGALNPVYNLPWQGIAREIDLLVLCEGGVTSAKR